MNNKSPVGMAGEDHGGGVVVVVGSNGGGGEESGSGSSSPKNKVKFLCSHGGKVLPRPSDGLLKYVGGETRVISVPRTVNFSEMTKKLNAMIDGAENMVLKYQLVPEDLDALVSVRNNEDLKHMIDEHDRHESGGSPLLRAFLFPSKPVVYVDSNHTAAAAAANEHYALEQRYIDAINGIIRTSPKGRLSPIKAHCTSSACSSPKSNSPDGHTADFVAVEPPSPFHGGSLRSGRLKMNRVRSSPSISSLSNIHSLNNVQQHDHHHHSHFHNNQSHHLHPPPPLAYPSLSPSRTQQQEAPPQGMGRPPPIITSVRGSNGINYYYSPSTSRPPKGYAYYEEVPGVGAAYGNVMAERVNSMPHSPVKSIWD